MTAIEPPARRLPSVARVLSHPALAEVVRQRGPGTVKRAVRALQDGFRAGGEPPLWSRDPGAYAAPVQAWLGDHVGHGYATLFNLTGVLLHSNLGRSPIARPIAAAALSAATRPLALEYDLASGQRGDRERAIRARLRLLTGSEDATVVNNNAAAVLLALNTLALGLEVPVSRGELVEIGGSFRLPEVMERAGCRLREVGTTNRTHAADYEGAIGAQTALLLKAHPSNYRINGFTAAVGVKELAALAHAHGLPAVVDAGSGALVALRRFGLPAVPTAQALIRAGADVVMFSGDKLLGGPQAGILIGRRSLVARMNANPLKRALRLDKIALALLDETLKLYEQPEALAERIPLYRNLALPLAELERRAGVVAAALGGIDGATIAIVPARAQLGSGSVPGHTIESRAVSVSFATGARLRAFEASLRGLRPAVLGRIAKNTLLLDMRGAEPLDELAETLRGAC